MKEKLKDTVRGIVAQGWCTEENGHKVMDVDLALAIADAILSSPDIVMVEKSRWDDRYTIDEALQDRFRKMQRVMEAAKELLANDLEEGADALEQKLADLEG